MCGCLLLLVRIRFSSREDIETSKLNIIAYQQNSCYLIDLIFLNWLLSFEEEENHLFLFYSLSSNIVLLFSNDDHITFLANE
jgi:hypothetical protein